MYRNNHCLNLSKKTEYIRGFYTFFIHLCPIVLLYSYNHILGIMVYVTLVISKWQKKREKKCRPFFSHYFTWSSFFSFTTFFDHCLPACIECHGAKSVKTFSTILCQFGHCLPFIHFLIKTK